MKTPIEIKHLKEFIENSLKNNRQFFENSQESYFAGYCDALFDVIKQIDIVYANSKT